MARRWSGDDVLEIGFGPGHGIKLLVRETPARSISGVDPSNEMVGQALARNQAAVEEGRVRLMVARSKKLPFAECQFSRVVAVSNFHVWPSLSEGLSEIHRVLKDDGILVVSLRRALRSPWPWSSPGLTLEELQADQRLLEECGFRRVRMATRKYRRRNVCLVAAKYPTGGRLTVRLPAVGQ